MSAPWVPADPAEGELRRVRSPEAHPAGETRRGTRAGLMLGKWRLNMRLHARIGVAASVIGVTGIGVAHGCHLVSHHEILAWSLSGLLIAAALLLLRRQEEAEAEDEASSVPDTCSAPRQPGAIAPPKYSTSVFTRRYWGWVTLGCGVIVALVTPSQHAPAPPPAAPKLVAKVVPPPPLVTNPPVIISPPVAVKFPMLKLQGIHLLPSHPAAIINGKTCVAGDMIAGVKVVAINPDGVLVELAGQERFLILGSKFKP